MYYKNGINYGSQQAIRNDNKDTSLPVFMTDELIESLGYLKIVEGVKPIPSAVQYIIEGSVEVVDGVPTQMYVLKDMFADTAEYIDMDGVIVPAKTKLENESAHIAKLQTDATMEMVKHFTDVTTAYIETKITEYNTSNGVAFANIDAFTKYAIVASSPHNAIAIRFITYVDNIWKAVRTYQGTATIIPTDAEFKTILDSVVF